MNNGGERVDYILQMITYISLPFDEVVLSGYSAG